MEGVRWRFECGTLSVPADYTQPHGEQVRLALTRERATDSDHRLGSLVINFGGPGDPGAATLRDFVGEVPSEIRARYDLVSFDPRGIGSSKPIECVDNQTVETLLSEDPTPNGAGDLRAFYDGTNDNVDLTRRASIGAARGCRTSGVETSLATWTGCESHSAMRNSTTWGSPTAP